MTLQSEYYNNGLVEGEVLKSYKITLTGFSLQISFDELSALTGLPLPTLEKLKQLFEKYGQDAANHFEEVL